MSGSARPSSAEASQPADDVGPMSPKCEGPRRTCLRNGAPALLSEVSWGVEEAVDWPSVDVRRARDPAPAPELVWSRTRWVPMRSVEAKPVFHAAMERALAAATGDAALRRALQYTPFDPTEEAMPAAAAGAPAPAGRTCAAKFSVEAGFDWSAAPPGVDPADGGVPPERVERKRQQLGFMLSVLARIVRPGDVIVDFCGSSGHLALPIAAAFPSCQTVIVDMKERCIEIARSRIERSGLRNVRAICGLVQDFTEHFDIGVALHACGEATDLSLAACRAAGAAYVMCPCCIGKIRLSDLRFPRSDVLRRCGLAMEDFVAIAAAADFAHGKGSAPSEPAAGDGDDADAAARRLCKTIVEADRNMGMAGGAPRDGYAVRLLWMQPPECTPKNDVIVGVPLRRAARGVDQRPQCWLSERAPEPPKWLSAAAPS